MSKEKSINEERTAGASYILTFYQHVTQLTDYYATYKNLMIELQAKHSVELSDIKSISEEERRALLVTIQNVRYIAHKAHIQYKCIMNSLSISEEENKLIDAEYSEINKGFIPKVSQVEAYVTSLNRVLIGEIVKSLLETSQSIISKTFDNA